MTDNFTTEVDVDVHSTADELIGNIDAIADELRAQAEENDRLGTLNDTTVTLLTQADLFAALQPTEYGGLGLNAYEGLRVYESLATVDVAMQWVSMAIGVASHFLRFLDPVAVEEMCHDGVPLAAGQSAPVGKAVPVAGGFKVSGRWAYGSGIKHARYVVGCAIVTTGDTPELDAGGTPKMVQFFAPAETVQQAGNWDVIGLRATGSVDYVVDDAFVPLEYTFALDHRLLEPVDRNASVSALTGVVAWSTVFHGAAALGGGRRLLNELAEFARVPSSRGVRLADDATFRMSYAKLEADFRSSRAYLYAAWTELQKSVDNRENPSRATMTDIKAATARLHDINVENATFAFRIAGGTSLRYGSFQRAYGDIMAMGQHLMVAQTAYGDVGRDFLGEAEGTQWGFFGLMDV